MPERTLITTPFSTVEELAARSGMSPEHTKELVELAKELMKRSRARERSAKSGSARAAAKKRSRTK